MIKRYPEQVKLPKEPHIKKTRHDRVNTGNNACKSSIELLNGEVL